MDTLTLDFLNESYKYNTFNVDDQEIYFKFKYLELSDGENPILEEYDKYVSGLNMEILDIDKFIKANDLREVTNPIFFVRDTIPTPDGLLSNEIFGITNEERTGIFAYISLNGTYLDPSCYKAWKALDPKVKNIVHGIGTYSVNSAGEFVEDPNGSNGIDFLKKSFPKLKFKKTDSQKRALKIDYIMKNKDRMFIKKYPIIPAAYRDVNTGSRNVGVGQLNKMYAQILTLARSPKEQDYYGLSKTNAVAGRIQETILAIYDWIAGNNNSMIKPDEYGTGLSKKNGLIKKAGMSRTSDYCNRVVLSAYDQRPDRVEDMMVDLDHTALPLSSAMVDFYPYMLFIVKRFFENEFSSYIDYPCIDSKGNLMKLPLKDPLIEFSDERITAEIKKYLHGNSDRFTPIEIPIDEDAIDFKLKEKFYMTFKGRGKKAEDINSVGDVGEPEAIYKRPLTWTDVFFMAAVEATSDKCILITRYPMDSRYNQFPTKVRVSSTLETEPMYVGNNYYKFYPKIRLEDINTDTSSKFIDTLIMSNLHLGPIGGDYDGDQATAKGVYMQEANEELLEYMDSKANYVDLGCNITKEPSKECIIALYSMTILPPDTKIDHPKFG